MEGAGLKLALVLWEGTLGGAETMTAMIAREWRDRDVDASVVFVTHGARLAERLERDGIPHRSVGLRRGRAAITHPRRLARTVAEAGPDGALLCDAGYLSAALRAGGYRGRIVGVEHGRLLATSRGSAMRRNRDRFERLVGARFRAADVGVSDFMVAELRRHPHARIVRRIYNGVDTSTFSPASPRGQDAPPLVIGTAARLVPGKGIDHLLHAAVQLRDVTIRIEIAGDGPERSALTALAAHLGVDDVVTFHGAVQRMPEFWRQCNVAVVPSDEFVESFSMSTVEAMACGVPVIATRNGGVPEVVGDAEAGRIVPPGDPAALARAIRNYAADPELRHRHAQAAHERASLSFGIGTSARQYLELFNGAL
jgi:glycosyltransferase involved in cell wall biosynthesis